MPSEIRSTNGDPLGDLEFANGGRARIRLGCKSLFIRLLEQCLQARIGIGFLGEIKNAQFAFVAVDQSDILQEIISYEFHVSPF